jgi:predicted RNase H-like nuclease (RuvC/YqgF family)
MSHNYTPQCESLYTHLRRAKKTLCVFAESNRALAESYRSLLEENEAKDKTIQSFEQKVLEQQQEIDDLKRELDCQPNDWDNDGSSNADCDDREYAAYRLGI